MGNADPGYDVKGAGWVDFFYHIPLAGCFLLRRTHVSITSIRQSDRVEIMSDPYLRSLCRVYRFC